MTRISRARFEEMVEEATVDCYNDSEKVTGWFTMIDDNLAVPFKASVLGMPVIVERVDLNANDQIVMICARGPHTQSIPLLDLPRPAVLPHGWEWVEAYQQWDRQTGTSQFDQ